MTTFSKIRTAVGSTRQYIEVSRNGKPFGTIWTYKNTKKESSPWQAQTLNDVHKVFEYNTDKNKALKDAKDWMMSQPD